MSPSVLTLLALALLVSVSGCSNHDSDRSTVILDQIPAECQTIAIRFSRRAPYHGNLSLWKPVEDGRIEAKLGPEFAPHRYGVDAIHIECRNTDGEIEWMMDNREAIAIGAGENVIDRTRFTTR